MKKSMMTAHVCGVALGVLSLAALGGQANAALLNAPVPANATITFDGLQWAWGGACPYSGGCYATGDLSYQGPLGWSLPSAGDLALVAAYDSADSGAFANLFLNNPGGNVPAGGTDPVSGAFFTDGGDANVGSCASPYFDTAAAWCDADDGLSGDWAGLPTSDGFAEQLYVRSAVPEASTWAMMLIGFAGVGFIARRRKSQDVAITA